MKLLILLSVLYLFSPISCIPGGWTYPLPPKDFHELAKLTNSILEELHLNENWTISDILSYQSQVVAGINHKLTAVLQNKNGDKKIVFWKVFEGFGSVGLVIGQNINVLNAEDVQGNNILELNTPLTDLFKNKILKLHKYYTNLRVDFNLRKFRWSYSLTRNGENPIYFLTYELEGTNNEISLWEHWINVDENDEKINLINNTLFIRKLPIGKIRTNKFLFSEKCEEIKSLLFCAVNKGCDEKGFDQSGLCSDKQK
jgi:hypothetical protein